MPSDLTANCFFCGEIKECTEENHTKVAINTILLYSGFSSAEINNWWFTPGSGSVFGFKPETVWNTATGSSDTTAKRLRNRVARFARITIEANGSKSNA